MMEEKRKKEEREEYGRILKETLLSDATYIETSITRFTKELESIAATTTTDTAHLNVSTAYLKTLQRTMTQLRDTCEKLTATALISKDMRYLFVKYLKEKQKTGDFGCSHCSYRGEYHTFHQKENTPKYLCPRCKLPIESFQLAKSKRFFLDSRQYDPTEQEWELALEPYRTLTLISYVPTAEYRVTREYRVHIQVQDQEIVLCETREGNQGKHVTYSAKTTFFTCVVRCNGNTQWVLDLCISQENTPLPVYWNTLHLKYLENIKIDGFDYEQNTGFLEALNEFSARRERRA